MSLRPYQQEAIDSIYTYFEEGNKGNPLIVAPTGSGKSHIIASFIQGVFEKYPDEKILILSHVKEILQQNSQKLMQACPWLPVGIYSAGLGSRRISRVTVAGIQSVYKRAREFGDFSLVLVDEAHLVPKKGTGRYLTFLENLRKYNTNIKVIGFTATPFRLDSGLLCEGEGKLFTDIIYDIPITELIDDGYLSPLVGKNSATQADLSKVKIRGGEFVAKEAAAAMDKEVLTREAVRECLRFASDRKSWLVFCTGIKHAHHVSDVLNANHIKSVVVTGDTPALERERILASFKAGKIRALVNCDVLTTGFDAPNTDAIILLRPTQSVGLYVQIVGRGSRLSEGKKDCLVLDFAGNFDRHGPIDQIVIKKKTKEGESCVEKAPSKTCPECSTVTHLSARECADCGYVFVEDKPKHDAVASSASPLSRFQKVQKHEVSSVGYKIHNKPGSPPSLRVEYQCGLRFFSEWVCFQHPNLFARKMAAKWWSRHLKDQFKEDWKDSSPTSTSYALQVARLGNALKTPKSIWVSKSGKYWEIKSIEFHSEEDAEELENTLMEIGI